jgi:hypothetical protein
MDKLRKILAIGFVFGAFAMVLTLIPDHRVGAQGFPIGSSRHPFVGTCYADVNIPFLSPNPLASCTISVPAGSEVVIQTVTLYGRTDLAQRTVQFDLDSNFTGPTGVVGTGPSGLALGTAPLFDSGFGQTGDDGIYTGTFAWAINVAPGSNVVCVLRAPPELSVDVRNNPTIGEIEETCNIVGFYTTLE